MYDYMALEHLHVGDVSNNGGEMVNEFILTGSPEIVKQLLLEQGRTMHFTDDFAGVSDEAEDAEQAVANGEDEYGPDFNDSDLQIADQVEPHG
ncbi:hypothetical protein B0A48_00478 [Cryoendolithus antarcticus]|uniref:Uncharacterized protein n=1 Tax=Cryoendolithus antarcticus TaxID=1507870 RepID=A0A1V8TUT6_9PEZI|nr:hypothetical protein B0A48_00478 [Cryoendolithus antarcticus]